MKIILIIFIIDFSRHWKLRIDSSICFTRYNWILSSTQLFFTAYKSRVGINIEYRFSRKQICSSDSNKVNSISHFLPFNNLPHILFHQCNDNGTSSFLSSSWCRNGKKSWNYRRHRFVHLSRRIETMYCWNLWKTRETHLCQQ